MKFPRRFLGFGLAVLLVGAYMLFAGCTGEKGDTGPAGPGGPAGQDGQDGEPGTTQCFGCHADTTTIITAPAAQWEYSMHKAVPNVERATGYGGACAPCHAGNTFVESLGKDGEYGNSSIDCFACHEPHTAGNFELRTDAAVTLVSGSTFDNGNGNLCAHCHHARGTFEENISNNEVFLDEHFGPHHSNQSDMLLGVGGYDFGGKVARKSELHYSLTEDGCVDCHMDVSTGHRLGGHSFNVEYEDRDNVAACESCHDDDFEETFDDRLADDDYDGDTELEGVQSEIEGLMHEIETELIALGYIDDHHHGLEDTVSVVMGGVVWNFMFVYEDQSHGAHNYDYALDLLETSLEELGKFKQSRGLLAAD
jgi:hypothetical protein